MANKKIIKVSDYLILMNVNFGGKYIKNIDLRYYKLNFFLLILKNFYRI